jgi:UDP-N-acetylglucosamine 2-epimerase (non-hydrolysing)
VIWISRGLTIAFGVGWGTLALVAARGTHGEQTARIALSLEPVITYEQRDLMVVDGDANSTMAAGATAAKADVPVVHIEAGLRSRDRSMPEEINRIVVDHLAHLLLTPTRDADDNLFAEGVTPDRIRFVGNTMIDSLRRFEPAARALDVARTDYGVDEYVLVTLHRPALVEDPLTLVEVVQALDEVAIERPVLFPMHRADRQKPNVHGLAAKAGSVARAAALSSLPLTPARRVGCPNRLWRNAGGNDRLRCCLFQPSDDDRAADHGL